MENVIAIMRPKSFDGTVRNDCSVLALSAALCEPYDRVLQALTQAGRKPREGTSFQQAVRATRALGYDFVPRLDQRGYPVGIVRRISERVPGRYGGFVSKRVTARHVLDYVPRRGHFYVTTTQHAFAVVDGLVYDNGGLSPRQRLDYYLKIDI